MQEEIHPEYKRATISCACGNTIETFSTRGSFKIDVCNACHPFYTGKLRRVKAQGRVEKFNKKYKRN